MENLVKILQYYKVCYTNNESIVMSVLKMLANRQIAYRKFEIK